MNQNKKKPDHPISILLQEHEVILDRIDKFLNVVQSGEEKPDNWYRDFAEFLSEAESHYIREENVLFPYLEKHGITQPPAVMWKEHELIRQLKKNIRQLINQKNINDELTVMANHLYEKVSAHFNKEKNILFQISMNVLTSEEWKSVGNEFNELGYCCFSPHPPHVQNNQQRQTNKSASDNIIEFTTGTMSFEEIEAILNTMPFDITFVDKDDTVKYFSQSADRIFPRSRAIIGRKVQQCHPPNSVAIVNRILQEFKSGGKDSAEFWIDLKERKIYIRYFAVRNISGQYLGCVEVTQDITNIKKIQGEKRLME